MMKVPSLVAGRSSLAAPRWRERLASPTTDGKRATTISLCALPILSVFPASAAICFSARWWIPEFRRGRCKKPLRRSG